MEFLAQLLNSLQPKDVFWLLIFIVGLYIAIKLTLFVKTNDNKFDMLAEKVDQFKAFMTLKISDVEDDIKQMGDKGDEHHSTLHKKIDNNAKGISGNAREISEVKGELKHLTGRKE